MFDTFYPTPKSLVEKMLSPYKNKWDNEFYGKTILEPSAGKGDICDQLPKSHIYCCEIEPEFRAILNSKGYVVLADDFLTYFPRRRFDYIIMNPPFNDIIDHILHAWEILAEGSDLITIAPVTCLERKTNRERLLADILNDNHAVIENVGKAFENAERQTDVECVIIWLKKPESLDEINFKVKNKWKKPETGETKEVAVLQSFISDLVAYYEAAINVFTEYVTAREKILTYCEPFIDYEKNPIEMADKAVEKWDVFYDALTENAWKQILNHPGFQGILTERARKMMDEFRKRQQKVDFTPENIKNMLIEISMKQDE